MSGYSQELIEKSMPDLSKHVLTEIQSGGPVSAYQLHRPEYGRMESCLILGTPEGVVIMGDFCPNRNHGCPSDYKYTVEWFAGKLGIGYLLEKFGLEEKYQPELAAEGVKFWLDEMLADEDLHPDWREWAEKEASRSFSEFCDLFPQIEYLHEYFGYGEWDTEANRVPNAISESVDWLDIIEAIGPSLSDVRVLVAIQRRFAELYPQLKAQKEAAGELTHV